MIDLSYFPDSDDECYCDGIGHPRIWCQINRAIEPLKQEIEMLKQLIQKLTESQKEKDNGSGN